jgi:hypothetical protein
VHRLVALALAIPLACAAAGPQITRSRAEVAAFRLAASCPATGQVRGACRGWQVDHIVPLCAGGLDTRGNMQWLTVEDHRFKTLVDVRECRKLARLAGRPAAERQIIDSN